MPQKDRGVKGAPKARFVMERSDIAGFGVTEVTPCLIIRVQVYPFRVNPFQEHGAGKRRRSLQLDARRRRSID